MATFLPYIVIEEDRRIPFVRDNFEFMMEDLRPKLHTISPRNCFRYKFQKPKEDEKEDHASKDKQEFGGTNTKPFSYVDILIEIARKAMVDAPKINKSRSEAVDEVNLRQPKVESNNEHEEVITETNKPDIERKERLVEPVEEIIGKKDDAVEARLSNSQAASEISNGQTVAVETRETPIHVSAHENISIPSVEEIKINTDATAERVSEKLQRVELNGILAKKVAAKSMEEVDAVEEKDIHDLRLEETTNEQADVREIEDIPEEEEARADCDQVDDQGIKKMHIEKAAEASSKETNTVEAKSNHDERLMLNDGTLLTDAGVTENPTIPETRIPIEGSDSSDFELKFNFDGYAASSINAYFENGLVIVTAKMEEDEGIKTICFERKLPADVDPSTLVASFRNDGTLELTGKRIKITN